MITLILNSLAVFGTLVFSPLLDTKLNNKSPDPVSQCNFTVGENCCSDKWPTILGPTLFQIVLDTLKQRQSLLQQLLLNTLRASIITMVALNFGVIYVSIVEMSIGVNDL